MGSRSLRSRGTGGTDKGGDSGGGQSEKRGTSRARSTERRASSSQPVRNAPAPKAGSNSKNLKTSTKTASAEKLSSDAGITGTEGGTAQILSNKERALKETQHVGNHQTRSRNGIRKEAKIFSPDDEADKKIPPQDSIDICAAILATLDERSYSRALLSDANSLLDRVVFPMSFPWAHQCRPVMRTIPRDIDEMAGIVYTEEEIHPGGKYGRFRKLRTVKERSVPDNFMAAAQRSTDPGVLEFTSLFPPTIAQKASVLPLHAPAFNGDPCMTGELALRKYEEMQGRKRRRELIENSNLKTTMISFRVGSTSSRSSIVGDVSNPILLPAELPIEVESGKRMKSSKSEHIVRSLGNYDCRHGSHKLGNGEHRVDERVRVGRTRLIWTQPDPSVSQRAFKSSLTGRPCEAGTHKRPRSVRVAVRVNGAILQTTNIAEPLSEKVFHDAIDKVCKPVVYPQEETRQCALDPHVLLAQVLKGDGAEKLFQKGRSFIVSLKTKFGTAELTVEPPKIECLASQDGLMYTMCSKRGTFSSRFVKGDGTGNSVLNDGIQSCTSILADLTSIDRRLCSICWSAYGVDGGTVICCESCKLTIHRSCCGRPIPEGRWKCDPCHALSSCDPAALNFLGKAQQHRWNIPCSMCHGKGGSFFLHEASRTWIHDTCRIWSTSEVNPPPKCALCNKSTRPIIRCAAKNCEVMFHPMCAIIASNAADLHRLQSKNAGQYTGEDVPSEYENDLFYSTQYRLCRLEVGSHAMNGTRVLPIAFCGYHNPSRRPDMQGLYPGALYLSEAMRIPPFNEDEK